MLLVHRDAQGRIDAALDWWVVDASGAWNPFGESVWVNQLELTAGVRLTGTLRRQMVARIARLAPNCLQAYWERRDKPGMRLHRFYRHQLLREEVSV